MAEAKIEIKIGQIQFSGEGEQDWVAKQLDKIIIQAEKLVQLASKVEADQPSSTEQRITSEDKTIAGKTLPAFLSEKQATKTQVKKFLATAIWLDAKGQKRLQTGDVRKALKESSQTPLSNPSQCLNKNLSKGYCAKDGKQFFVTDDGRNNL